jgi:hypothetical protein
MNLNCFPVYFIFLFADIVFAGLNRHALETCDTMDIYMSANMVGTLTHSISCNDSAAKTIEQTDISINAGQGNNMSMHEIRMYDSTGFLSYTCQEMRGPSGVNIWELKKNKSIWNYTVTVGGNKTQSQISSVNDNFASTRKLILGVKDKTIKNGETWNDTSFELISGRKTISKIKCINIDTVNRRCFFSNTDDISGRAETVMLDSNAQTLELSFDGIYTAKSKKNHAGAQTGIAESGNSAYESPDITGMFSVKADRMVGAGEIIAVKPADSSATLDSSVKEFYLQKNNAWLLRPLPDKCLSSATLLPYDQIRQWLLPSIAIQSDNREIVKLADSLRKGEKNSCEIITRLNRYVYSFLKKRNTPTFSNALETLHAGYGDCGEHSALLAALLRASGIPAQVVLGLFYVENKKAYFYHAQVMAYSRQWIFADPTWNVFPSSGKFIPLLIDDTGSKTIFLSRLINKLCVEYVKKGD